MHKNRAKGEIFPVSGSPSRDGTRNREGRRLLRLEVAGNFRQNEVERGFSWLPDHFNLPGGISRSLSAPGDSTGLVGASAGST